MTPLETVATLDDEYTFDLPKSLLVSDGLSFDENADEDVDDDTQTGGQDSPPAAADVVQTNEDTHVVGGGVQEDDDHAEAEADTIVVATLGGNPDAAPSTAVMDGDTIVIDKSPVEDHAVKYTVKQLRDILKANQLATNGGKGALIQRLVDHQIAPFHS